VLLQHFSRHPVFWINVPAVCLTLAVGAVLIFQDRVTVAACLAAATTAILAWVENDGTPELPDLIEQAFDALTRSQ
jgi:hypothetical protein